VRGEKREFPPHLSLPRRERKKTDGMRQRKRAQWPLSVYQYWVRLPYPSWAQLPAAVQQETESMRTLWNQLVETFERRQTASRVVLAQFPSPRDDPSTAQQARLLLRGIRQSFLAEARGLTAQCPTTWANREFILNQFLVATDRFFKRQGGPPQRKNGVPREVHFHHRFTSGGLPVERIFGSSQRLHLDPISADALDPAFSQRQRKRLARTSGSFQVKDFTLSFVTILHRPLPPGAYLKTAALIGKQVMFGGYHQHREGGHSLPARWQWALHLTLEIPPQEIPAQRQERPVAALDLSFHLWHERQLRIGVLTDSTGREEALFLPEKILAAWRHKRALQSAADHLLEETKQQLRHLQCPARYSPAIRRLFSHLGKTRAPGLWRLLQLLEETGAGGDAVDTLRHWADRSTKLLREARGLERSYRGHRDWFYHNVALQLCHRYQQLVVTATDLQTITVKRQKPETTTRAQEIATYRQLTSPARFLQCLRQAASKTDTEITRDNLVQP